ncbi:hypothetical protein V5O48_000263 [Marasmius crinis-equi]|uniref:Cytochrome P450 n=1 Tax=Marasmius crinis-equi TaxID=585013 RepID=A0ABR3G1R5_9AGAR
MTVGAGYEQYGWDLLLQYSVSSSSLILSTADANAIKDVLASNTLFPRYLETYKPLALFGPSVLSSEGDEWKRYKKIVKPAFTDRHSRMGWNDTIQVMTELFEEEWAGKEVVEVENCLEFTLSTALLVLSAAIFGQRLSWKEDGELPEGHDLTFKQALFEVSSSVMIKTAAPGWAGKVSKRIKEIQDAFGELDKYMIEMVQNRDKSDQADLFSSLLRENSAGDDKAALTVREMVGNVFVLLVAGHETAAHTLCFAFMLLALHQEEQDALYQEVRTLLPDGKDPVRSLLSIEAAPSLKSRSALNQQTYEEMPLFTRAMAVYYETLRMFPPVTWIPKVCAENTVLTATSTDGTRTEQIPVPHGTNVTVDVVGLHYNPRYWKDPSEFRPSRFLGSWNKDAFIPFSTGSHACLGRKFFEFEAIAILTMLITKYKIEIPTKNGETFEQKKARVLATTTAITLT